MNTLTQKIYNPEELVSAFKKMYGESSEKMRVFSSPARINIIGEHIDYNGGKVFPAAINKYLYVAIRKRSDSKIIYNDLRFPGSYEFDINENFVFDKKNDYANYLNGILSEIKKAGFLFSCGFEILMVSNIPAGGGISSSSALECGFAYAVSETFGFGIDRVTIAKLGQLSEHRFIGLNCGIMDQFIIATGKKNTAELLDCASLEYEYAPLDLSDFCFVVMNTNKMRKLSDSKYNERRSQCQKALKLLNEAGVKCSNLCELTVEQWKDAEVFIKDEILLRRARHCVYENRRVLDAFNAVKNGNLAELGELLNKSHESLKSDYEVTGVELDTLAFAAQKQEGCLGARMTGAGFGGCAIALVRKSQVEKFEENVQAEYTKVTGYEAGFFACETGDGVAALF